jgi:ABC-type polysaccharide/polyol phosphate transport system ATPase subunit
MLAPLVENATAIRSSARPTTPAIVLQDVSLVFCNSLNVSSRYAAADLGNPLRLFGWTRRRLRPGEFYALRGIDLEIAPGETLGVTGTCRSGKSALVNLIAGLYRPSAGRVVTRGSCLLVNSVGTGFRPMLSVWENVMFRAVLLGAPRRGLAERCQAMIDFADLTGQEGRQLHNLDPLAVKRLGIAVALHIESDIVVFDELLCAGDLAFKEKSFERACELIRSRTAVVVSHDVELLTQLSDRVLVLDRGQVVALGDPRQAIEVYQELSEEAGESGGDLESLDDLDLADELDEACGGEDGRVMMDHLEEMEQAALASQARRAEHKPRPTRDRGELRRLEVEGKAPFDTRHSLLLRPGEDLRVHLEWEAKRETVCEQVRIGLHQPGALVPLAACWLHAGELFPGRESPPRLAPGERIELSFTVTIPQLLSGYYGLSLTFMPHAAPIAKHDITKLFVFGMLSRSQERTTMRLQVGAPTARLAAAVEWRENLCEVGISGQQNDWSVDSPKDTCDVGPGFCGRGGRG